VEKKVKSKSKPRAKGKKFPKGSKTYGYSTVSNAVCVVVYDYKGMPMKDKIAEEIADAVTELAVKYSYVVSWTRQ
jgi:hypothetical protein